VAVKPFSARRASRCFFHPVHQKQIDNDQVSTNATIMKDVQFLLTDSYFVACARSRVLFNAISEKLINDLMTARKGKFYGEKWENFIPEDSCSRKSPSTR
jgi:hypothetical protein